jgi:hypothetical protein
MKVLRKIINIFILSVIGFIILNILFGYLWSLKTKYKFNNLKPYSNEVLEVLKLNEKESLILYLETWQKQRLFEYEQFTGHIDSPRKNFKYVNFTKLNGRKIKNKNICDVRFFFYGGETTFGYNVTDKQTFSSYFSDILNNEFPNKNYCVFNFGRKGYFSTQENILFQQHLLKKRFQPGDFIFFVDGANEGGNKNVIGSLFLEDIYIHFHQKYWDIYKHTFPIFFSSLPIIQFVERLQQKIKKNNNPQLQNVSENINNEMLLSVFQNNIDIRISICKRFVLNCYTFLQPLAGIHGIYFDNIPKNIAVETRPKGNERKKNQKKYSILKKAENFIDITDSLNNEKKLSYVDGINYSPPGNKSIAKYIYQIVEKKIKSIN